MIADLWKDFWKIQDWNIKWFSQLKIKKDDLVKKYNSNLEKWEKLQAKTFDELYENALEERPYIGDPKQLSFYFSRNIKTFISVSILLYIAVKAFQMFLNSFNLFIDNLLWNCIL